MHALLGSEESWAAIDTSETDFPTWDGDTVVGLIANYWAEPYLPDMRVENVRAYSVVEAQGCSTETLNSVFR
jgi:hypothetical protein